MSAKERILAIRLMEKLQEHPAYAKALEIEVRVAPATDKKEK